jgi:hypothetical protein
MGGEMKKALDTDDIIIGYDFTGKNIGIDLLYELHRLSLGARHVKVLTSASGMPTLFINGLIQTIIKFKKLGVKNIIYIIDSPVPNPIKAVENKKRQLAKQAAELLLNKLKSEDEAPPTDKKQALEVRSFKLTSEMIEISKKIITMMGQQYIIARQGFEAEHLGAELTKKGIIDTLYTSDADAWAFGATNTIRPAAKSKKGKKEKENIKQEKYKQDEKHKQDEKCKQDEKEVKRKQNKNKEYEHYILQNILQRHSITYEQFVHLYVILGCDFCTKSRGVTYKTIFKKGLLIELTEEQRVAKKYFMTECPFDSTDIVGDKQYDKESFVQWIVADFTFNQTRLNTMLNKYIV